MSEAFSTASFCQSWKFHAEGFFFPFKYKTSQGFCHWCYEPISIFFNILFGTINKESRQCLPIYLTEWQWLSALLFSPHSHFPVRWWILTPRHCVGGMPETALHSTLLVLHFGWGTLLMFLMKLGCSIELFYALLMPIYIHRWMFRLISRQQNVACVYKCTYKATVRPCKTKYLSTRH